MKKTYFALIRDFAEPVSISVKKHVTEQTQDELYEELGLEIDSDSQLWILNEEETNQLIKKLYEAF